MSFKLKDQFYTKPKVAEYCFDKFKKIGGDLGGGFKRIYIY